MKEVPVELSKLVFGNKHDEQIQVHGMLVKIGGRLSGLTQERAAYNQRSIVCHVM